MRLLLLFLAFVQAANACVFCKQEIVQQQSLYEGAHFNILLDIEPRVNGHLLLVSKRHVAKAHELTAEEWSELSLLLSKAVTFFSDYLQTDQYLILEKNGPKAFQQIPHVHFHLFPVTTQKWPEIFDIIPIRLSQEEINARISLFRPYFLE